MDTQNILIKIQRYCAYQERCTTEVVTKLKKLGALESDINKLVNQLKNTSFLDDERFAFSFAESKFNQKKWGLKKISAHLFQKGISKENIEKAISSISSEEISGTLNLLYEKKWLSLSHESDPFKRKQKTLRYLLSKGYSYDEISIYFD